MSTETATCADPASQSKAQDTLDQLCMLLDSTVRYSAKINSDAPMMGVYAEVLRDAAIRILLQGKEQTPVSTHQEVGPMPYYPDGCRAPAIMKPVTAPAPGVRGVVPVMEPVAAPDLTPEDYVACRPGASIDDIMKPVTSPVRPGGRPCDADLLCINEVIPQLEQAGFTMDYPAKQRIGRELSALADRRGEWHGRHSIPGRYTGGTVVFYTKTTWADFWPLTEDPSYLADFRTSGNPPRVVEQPLPGTASAPVEDAQPQEVAPEVAPEVPPAAPARPADEHLHCVNEMLGELEKAGFVINYSTKHMVSTMLSGLAKKLGEWHGMYAPRDRKHFKLAMYHTQTTWDAFWKLAEDHAYLADYRTMSHHPCAAVHPASPASTEPDLKEMDFTVRDMMKKLAKYLSINNGNIKWVGCSISSLADSLGVKYRKSVDGNIFPASFWAKVFYRLETDRRWLADYRLGACTVGAAQKTKKRIPRRDA